MATFRNGLDTWLKQECATKADNLTVIFRLASSAATAAYRGDKALADNQIEAILARVETDLPRNPKKEPEIEQLGEWITDAYHGKEVVSNMEKFAQMMHKLAFEKVIECQCGKSKPSSVPGYYVGQKVIVVNTHEEIDGETVTIKSIDGSLIEVQRHGKPNTIIYRWNNLLPIPEKE